MIIVGASAVADMLVARERWNQLRVRTAEYEGKEATKQRWREFLYHRAVVVVLLVRLGLPLVLGLYALLIVRCS